MPVFGSEVVVEAGSAPVMGKFFLAQFAHECAFIQVSAWEFFKHEHFCPATTPGFPFLVLCPVHQHNRYAGNLCSEPHFTLFGNE